MNTDIVEKILEKFVVTEIAKGNHAIMVFDGWVLKKMQTFDPDNNYQNPGSNDYYVYEKGGLICRIEDIEHDIVYHQSWNALMPVVEKIETLEFKDSTFEVWIMKFDISILSLRNGHSIRKTVYTLRYDETKEKLSTLWQAVIQFIHFHNQQSK